jgi:formate dehydrogenase alpha subunit
VVGLGETLGSGAMTNDFESIKSADTILIIGSNTTENHPVIGSFIKERKKKGNCTLIVCDPRKIEMAKYADVYIRQKGGSDVALLNGLMHVIIRDGLYAEEFIEKNVNNFEKLRETVAKYTPEYVSGITGVAPELIGKAAKAYAKGPNSAIFYTMGITQHLNGTDNVRSVANLALLCGMLGRPGTGVNPLRGQNNVQGACDTGCLPEVIPGYQKVALPATHQKVKEIWGCELPAKPGLSVVEMMKAAGEGEIKGMYIMGENSMVTEPDSDHVRHALKNLEFLVVQDIFLTETAEFANVVLPAAGWGEKDGTFTNTCRSVQRVRKAVESPGEARPDWEILLAVGKRFGAPWNDMNSPETVFNEIGRIAPAYAGITYGRLEGGALAWPCPACDHPGTPILYAAGFPRGKADFSPCEWQKPEEWPTEEYPFIATTGRLLYHYHSGSMTRRSAPGEFIKEMYIEVNPADAEALDVRDGEMVKVVSRRGEVCGAAKITDRVPAGTIFLPFHFSESSANLLTSSKIDPYSKTPGFKVSAVKLEKAV